MMTTREAAKYLGMSVSALALYRRNQTGPTYFKGEGRTTRVYYRRQDLDAWKNRRALQMVKPKY